MFADFEEKKALFQVPRLGCARPDRPQVSSACLAVEKQLCYSTQVFMFFHFSTLAVISDNLLIFIKESSISESDLRSSPCPLLSLALSLYTHVISCFTFERNISRFIYVLNVGLCFDVAYAKESYRKPNYLCRVA